MTKEIKELSRTLIHNIQKLIDNIDFCLSDQNNEIEKYEENPNDSIKKKFQKQHILILMEQNMPLKSGIVLVKTSKMPELQLLHILLEPPFIVW